MGATLTTTLTAITSVMTSLFGGIADVFDVITEQPLLFIGVSIPIVGAVVGFAKRMFRVG